MTECKHGQLERQCYTCELEQRVAELDQYLSDARYDCSCMQQRIAELERAVNALYGFAQTVAGGASWWDDVWPKVDPDT